MRERFTKEDKYVKDAYRVINPLNDGVDCPTIQQEVAAINKLGQLENVEEKLDIDLKCPYKIKSIYQLPSFYHPTLVPTHTVEIIYVPDYAVDYAIDYFMKKDILAVLYKDFKTFSKYGIYPRYLIKKSKVLSKEDFE